jgi:hypothetical protein
VLELSAVVIFRPGPFGRWGRALGTRKGEERCAAVVGGDVAWLDSTFESLVTGGRFGVGHASVPVHLGSWQNSRRYPWKLGA